MGVQEMGLGNLLTYQAFEILVRQVFEHPGFLPKIFFVAIDNGRYVGQSDLVNEKEDREHPATGYTGVDPDYRRRGQCRGND